MTEKRNLWGIGEVARRLGIEADTLRFYERQGILPPPERNSSGRRRYSPTEVEAIERLVALKSTGMSLADIAAFAQVEDGKLHQTQVETLKRHHSDLVAERRRLDAGLAFIEHKLAAYGPATVTPQRLPRPDGTIAYAVQGHGPWLFLIGAPVGRAGFEPLAQQLSDSFTVVTHDPRGIGDSIPFSGAEPTPGVLAADVIALVRELTNEPAYFFGTSGGAVTILELLAQAPGLCRKTVVHEAPLLRLLRDQELERRASRIFALAIADPQTAFEEWLDLTGAGQSTRRGQRPEPQGSLPPLPSEDLDKNRYFLGHMAGPTVTYTPDIDALLVHPPTICAGEESHAQLAHRSSQALADLLDVELVEMPGNHLGASTHAAAIAESLREHFAEPAG